jgi:hypothetical protein
LKKEISENIRTQKDIPCLSNGRNNNVKITILLNAIYKFNSMPIKIPIILQRNRKGNPKIHMEE